MDIKPQTTQPISDDQDLAKVLAGVSNGASATSAQPAAPLPPLPDLPPEPEPVAQPKPAKTSATVTPVADNDLDNVKNEAIKELRPLVDKLNISAEEKFDTYLLLIRSTDDKTLIAPAHEAAKNIADESRRAQALLDVIKEIDFLSNPQP
ncbi:hypothetical protein EUA61_00895 [TM7 phylum sp. oral taxon 346]|jgi:bifunctional phosphoglucose/phosphomannose isomerase|nr:hypothetical protein EUA61_00895 [TM7 phylum sp. oral taxon 346]